MKKSLIVLPLLCCASFGALAKSYINVSYGMNSPSTDERMVFTNANGSSVAVSPETSDSMWGVTFGYDTGNNTSVEFGYNRFQGDSELETLGETINGLPTTNEYQTNMTANQIVVTPMYHRSVNNRMNVKGGAGVTYTDYEFTGSHHREQFDTSLGPIPGVTAPATKSLKKWGVVASVGADYSLMEGITVGVQANYSYDSVASNKSIVGVVGFRF